MTQALPHRSEQDVVSYRLMWAAGSAPSGYPTAPKLRQATSDRHGAPRGRVAIGQSVRLYPCVEGVPDSESC